MNEEMKICSEQFPDMGDYYTMAMSGEELPVRRLSKRAMRKREREFRRAGRVGEQSWDFDTHLTDAHKVMRCLYYRDPLPRKYRIRFGELAKKFKVHKDGKDYFVEWIM